MSRSNVRVGTLIKNEGKRLTGAGANCINVTCSTMKNVLDDMFKSIKQCVLSPPETGIPCLMNNMTDLKSLWDLYTGMCR